MLQLIAENPQAHGSSRDRSSTACTLSGEGNQFLSRRTAKMCGHLVQQHRDGFDACFGYGLGTGKRFEHCKGSRQAGINKDLRELWEEDHHERLDLILVGSCLITQLG